MDLRPRAFHPMILLIGNYPLDRQQSMQRFAMMMLEGLTSAGLAAELDSARAIPRPISIRGELRRKVAGLHR